MHKKYSIKVDPSGGQILECDDIGCEEVKYNLSHIQIDTNKKYRIFCTKCNHKTKYVNTKDKLRTEIIKHVGEKHGNYTIKI